VAGPTTRHRQNAGTLEGSGSPALANPGGLSLGARFLTDVGFADVHIVEVVGYDGDHDTTDETTVRDGLNARLAVF
jgi:hypothetical protein